MCLALTCIGVPVPCRGVGISHDFEKLVEKDGANELGGIVNQLRMGGKASMGCPPIHCTLNRSLVREGWQVRVSISP